MVTLTSPVEDILTETFCRSRAPRSPEYQAGVRAALQYRLNGLKVSRPYPVGTAAADAFFSGLDEGHAIWRRLRREAPP